MNKYRVGDQVLVEIAAVVAGIEGKDAEGFPILMLRFDDIDYAVSSSKVMMVKPSIHIGDPVMVENMPGIAMQHLESEVFLVKLAEIDGPEGYRVVHQKDLHLIQGQTEYERPVYELTKSIDEVDPENIVELSEADIIAPEGAKGHEVHESDPIDDSKTASEEESKAPEENDEDASNNDDYVGYDNVKPSETAEGSPVETNISETDAEVPAPNLAAETVAEDEKDNGVPKGGIDITEEPEDESLDSANSVTAAQSLARVLEGVKRRDRKPVDLSTLQGKTEVVKMPPADEGSSD